MIPDYRRYSVSDGAEQADVRAVSESAALTVETCSIDV